MNRPPLLLVLLFLASGACGLVYQVTWARELVLVLGSSTTATSAVLVAFMGGFALGGWALARTADRARRPLALYGALEVGIGLGALAVPRAVAALEPLYASAARESSSPVALAALRFGVAVLALVLPTALMGGSLPAIVADARRRGGASTPSVSSLYGANLVGAVVGSTLAGFVLIRTFGLSGANRLAALTSLLVGAVAFLAARDRGERAPDESDGNGSATDGPELSARSVNPLTFASGFLVLALEVTWTRLLVFTLGSTVYGFSVVLSSTLVGLALGSALAGRLGTGPRGTDRLALSLAGVAVTAAAGFLATPHLFALLLALSRVTGTGGGAFVASSYLAAALVLLVPATLAGVAFPVLAARASAGDAGLGRAQAWNSLGAVLGAGVAGLVLVPRLGLAGTLALVAFAYLAQAFLLARGRARAIVVGAAVATAALLLASRLQRADAVDAVLRGEAGGDPPALLAYREGPVATASVVEDRRGRALRVDGFEAAAIGGDYRYMRLMALAPLLLHPAPRDGLVICFGTGTTAGTLARDPGLAHLDIVEIEPVVLELANFFKDRNGGVLRQSKVSTHVDDGRAFLVAARPASLDLVTLEPLPPTHAGVVALYSREFYEHAARALRPEGVACQWVPTQFLRPQDARTIVGTFASVFPNSVMLVLDTTGVLVGTRDSRSLLDPASLAKRLAASPPLGEELRACGIGSVDELIVHAALDRDGVARFAAGEPLTTDDDPRLEYAPPRHRVLPMLGGYTPWQAEMLLALGDVATEPARSIAPELDARRRVHAAIEATRVELAVGRPDRAVLRLVALARTLESEGQGLHAASAHLAASQRLLAMGLRDPARRELERAAAACPTHPGLAAARAAVGN